MSPTRMIQSGGMIGMYSISGKLTAIVTCDWSSIALSHCTICTWNFHTNESLHMAVKNVSACEAVLFTGIFGSSLVVLCNLASEWSG
jgi:hypothetical protein